jgi:beta-glucanase (GH16 family)
MDANVVAFAGFIHGFENETVDAWIPQNWSTYGGFSFWLYGNNSGTSLFIDLLDNRNPGSTTDDAERWTVAFTDNFTGWQKFEFPFADFTRKEIGNGAPNDGLTLTEVHGWAFGTLNTDGPITYYMDDVALYGFAEVPELAVSFSTSIFEIDEGTTGNIVVRLNRPMNEDDPAQVSVDYVTEPSTARPGRDYTPTAGTLTFVNGGPSEQSFPLETFTDGKFLGNKRVVLRLSNLVDVAPGFSTQGSALIIDIDPYDPYLLDDFERGAYLWNSNNVTLNTPEIMTGDSLAVPGQGDYEHILQVDTAVLVDIVISGSICNSGNGAIPVALLTTDSFDALSVNHNSVRFGDALETHRDKKTGEAQRHEDDFEGDGDLDLIFHFRANETGFDCDSPRFTLIGETFDGQAIVAGGEASFGRDFAIGQDWTRGEALNFWFYGTNSGDAITVQLKDNRAPDPGPTSWNLVWSDEFNDPTGTPPNPANWIYEIGDVTPDGKNGWGNEELQYYTDDPANSSTDGNGNLVITLREADGSLECYYGTCEYTSARLLTQHRKEFAYGRIESRLLVPDGADGLWPAFWSLGSDIVRNPWPGSGEIDYMEYVSRIPNEIFGTIHGPGYSGGASFGDTYDFGAPVYNDYHTFAVEWEPNEIRWYVDDILYHTATPADVAPNEWVFDKPFFMLLNFAIGGNFGGSVSPDLVFPQEYLIDYVRLYQAPDTAERFEASFADNFNGWQQVVIPFDSLVRSADQPAGAPDDGLTLSEVWGYGFDLAEGGTTSGTMQLDQVRLQLLPPPTEITVTNLNDSGTGSLRQALEDIAIGGTITFDPGLAVGTIHSTGPLVLSQDVTIDSSDAPGINLNGGGTDRLLIVDPGVNAIVNGLTFTNGYGFQLAGCVLNNGALTLDHVTVTGCLMTTDAGDFWQGGGGIYSGDGATLNLIDSTVSNNTSGWTGGGLYSFFNSTTNVIRSTVSGNVALDVAGGFRTLGEVNIENSTISGNTSTTWHGGAMFITDGVATITNSTITGNAAPGGTTGGLFVGTFTAASATLNLQNTIVVNNGDFGCFLAPFGAGAVALNSLGNNLFTDGTCFPVGSDLIVADAGIDSLSDNGGPTLTHALLAGSPAIGAANTSVCPATDQRGVARDAACDIGSYEFP